MSGPAIAWVLAVVAIGHATGKKPLPREAVSARVGDWSLTINNTNAEVDDLEPFDVRAENEVYLAIAVLGPAGGMIGGCREDAFIEDMKRSIPENEWRELLGESA